MDALKNQSAVIDMNSLEEMEIEDNEFELSKQKSDNANELLGKDYMSSVREKMTSYMWQESKQKAETAFKSYVNVDLLRPYFDVEPSEVFNRFVSSFIPIQFNNDTSVKLVSEFYGPTMLCFTLVAVLLLEMKSSSHSVQEGTLMGSALFTVFGYWFGASGLLWIVAYICNAQLRPTQVSTLIGYALTSHVMVTFINTLVHSNNSHVLFYCTWTIFGGLTTSKIVAVISSRTPGYTERTIFCGLASILHMFFLLYLHFAYHDLVVDLSNVIASKAGG